METSHEPDYQDLAARYPKSSDLSALITGLIDAWSTAYRARTTAANLCQLDLKPWAFLFDYSSQTGADQWDRTIAAWGLSAPGKRPRDQSYQRGYPSPNGRAERPLDKGHMVPHQVGGDLGPNIFPQDRALNRGWSDEGKRYRAFERAIGSVPDTFFFCRLAYTDETDFPTWVELGAFRSQGLHVERFRNRFE